MCSFPSLYQGSIRQTLAVVCLLWKGKIINVGKTKWCLGKQTQAYIYMHIWVLLGTWGVPFLHVLAVTLSTSSVLQYSLKCWDICSKCASGGTWDKSSDFSYFLFLVKSTSWNGVLDRLLHCFAVLPPFPLVAVAVCCLAAWCGVLETAQSGGGRGLQGEFPI